VLGQERDIDQFGDQARCLPWRYAEQSRASRSGNVGGRRPPDVWFEVADREALEAWMDRLDEPQYRAYRHSPPAERAIRHGGVPGPG
jgi:hypothetical protein